MDPLLKHPRVMNHRRFAKNGGVVDASFLRSVVQAQNHIAQYRRKVFFRSGSVFCEGDAHADFITTARWRCHAGLGAARMVLRIGFLQDVEDAATDPRVTWTIQEAGSPGTAQSLVIRCGSVVQTGIGVNNSPSLISWVRGSLDVTENTSYECVVSRTDNYVRPYSYLAYEEADTSANTSGFQDNQSGVNGAIVAATRQSTLQSLSRMWRWNGAQLLNYTNCDTSLASTFTTTTFLNVVDPLLSAYSEASPGWRVGDGDFRLGKQTRLTSGNALNCVLAAYGSMSAGSTGEVRLINQAGTIATLTGISTTPQWYSTAFTMSNAHTVGKIDVMARTSNAANTLTLHAVSVYTYLA